MKCQVEETEAFLEQNPQHKTHNTKPVTRNPQPMKTFRASEKQNSDLVFLINTQNSDEFYVYEGSQRPFKHGQIYNENQLIFNGRYVEPSSKQKKRMLQIDEGYTILNAQQLTVAGKSVILEYTRKGWKRYNADVYRSLDAARKHIAYLCQTQPRHIEDIEY